MVRRRTILKVIGPSLLVNSGCVTSGLSRMRISREISITNLMNERKPIRVTIKSSEGEIIFEHTYDIEPGKTDETKEVTDKPATIIVEVDDSKVEFGYAPPENCSPGDIILAVRSSNNITMNISNC